MKSLNTYIQENFKFKINRDNDVYAYHPTTFDELRQIIEERYKEQGPGTENEPINFNDIDVSGMTTFYNESNKIGGIFEKTEFEYIDISEWDVSHVIDMNSMFIVCHYLVSIGDLSNWNVSNVKDMGWMFASCTNLESIGDLSKWDISDVADIHGMFYSCTNLKSIGDISRWDTSSVKNMDRIFTHSGITNTPDWYKI